LRRAAFILVVAALAVSCGRSKPVGLEPGPGDAGPEVGATGVLRACLDTPTALTRAPSGALPCDLIPPGLEL
jgi:hypothetical protein